jgi:curved DNA-binding protein CbpA
VKREASDAELRAAYRRLVQLHHPDHNGGSAESARRFEEVQDAYARLREARARGPAPAGNAPPRTSPDPAVDARLANLERELREAQAARERARRAAQEATRDMRARPSDEELGYVRTDDSFTRILADAEAELSKRFSNAREHPAAKRLSDLIDELAAKLTGEPPR